jgi:hypothetical protein
MSARMLRAGWVTLGAVLALGALALAGCHCCH